MYLIIKILFWEGKYEKKIKNSEIGLIEELKIIKKIISDCLKDVKETAKRGRKPFYKIEDIIFFLILKIEFKLSYRQLRRLGFDFYEKVPVISNLYYRFKQIDEEIINKILLKISEEILKKIKFKQDKVIAVVDGTGFGYNCPYYQRTNRGVEIRKIKSHVKVVYILFVKGRKRIIRCVGVGGAYEDERKILLSKGLLKKIKKRKGARKGYLLFGDKLYGMSKEVIKESIRQGYIPIFKVEDGVHNRVRDELRLWVKRIYESNKELYKGNRFHIEGKNGNIKIRYESYEECKVYEIARSFVLVKFLLYTLYEYINTGGGIKNFLFFYFLLNFNKIYFKKGILEQP